MGAIGQWAGAIATFLAVVVALHQSRQALAIKVKVTITHGYTAGPNGGVDLVFANAINMSHRTITLTNFAFILPDGQQLILMSALRDFPKTVEPLHKTSVVIPCSLLAEGLRERGIKSAILLPAAFTDSTGGEHRCKKWSFDPSRW